MLRIDIAADVICPWCYIGMRRLQRALAMRPQLCAARQWRPFQLMPEMPPDGLPYPLHLELKFGGRPAGRMQAALAAAGEREGIAFAFERIGRTPNTLDAHRLIRLAAAEGCGDAVVDALFRGYFCEGRDVGDPEVLADVAADCGLDRGFTRAFLARGTGARDALEAERRVRRSGIDAVPWFVVAGEFALAGAQDPEAFLPLFDLAATAPAPLEAIP